eukprot:3238372-Amphidinium_carterae.1
MEPVAERFTSKFQITDPDCPYSNIDFNRGMSQSRTCAGTCFYGHESRVGDGICDCPFTQLADGSIQCEELTIEWKLHRREIWTCQH